MASPFPPLQVQYTSAGVAGAEAGGEGEAMVRGLQATRLAVDEKLEKSRIQLFAGGRALKAEDMQSDDEEEEEEEGSELEGGSGSDSELGSDDDGEDGLDSDSDDDEVRMRLQECAVCVLGGRC